MLTCKEVSRAIAADEQASADWRQRWSIKLHLLMCRHCRRYARQIQVIGDAARQIFSDPSTDPGSHERLRTSILDRISDSDTSDCDPPV